ncbi:MAG TPA: Maf family protein [Sphingobacterium sp.]|nr:Maf family protein [Sphingobacterium sp.]
MLLDQIKQTSIILGSQSPRRRELLASMDIDFEVEIRPADEYIDSRLTPEEVVVGIATAKLEAFESRAYGDKLIITADTIVVSPLGTVLGKPQDSKEAFEMIRSLSGQEHQVMTGVALQYRKKTISFVETTRVWFQQLTDDEIHYYIRKYCPFDKAGSYGIQEWIGRVAIDKIEGSYENVMGLPTQRLYRELIKFIK